MATINKRGRSWQLNWSDAEGQHRLSLGPITRQEAEIRRREKELECLTGRRFSVHSVAFEDFAAEYLTWYAQHYPSTYGRTAGIFKNSLMPHFGHLPMEQIVPADMTAWLVKRKEQKRRGKSPSAGTVSKEARALLALFNMAVKWRVLSTNPLDGVEAPPERRSKSPQYYSRDELARLYAASPNHSSIWRFMANTGLRRNEALYLKLVDIKADAIDVQSLEERPTKTRRSRSVPLNAAARQAVEDLSQPDAEYLLPRIDPRSLSRAFKKCAKRAKLPGELHTLRHTFISHLVMAGVDLPTVQKLAGHASISTTMRYAHLFQPHIQASVQKIAL
jgi:integrase